MDQHEFSTVECLTFLRAANASLTSALSARAKLPNETRDKLLDMNRQLNNVITEVWDTIGTGE